MSTKHIYFFDNKFDITQIDFLSKKYKGINVRKVKDCLMPDELTQYSAYTLDDHHYNAGIGETVLNSPEFKEMLEFHNKLSREYSDPGYTRVFINNIEETEKYTLEKKHIFFDILLCCDIDTAGIAAMYRSEDVVSLDLRNFNVEYKNLWDITINTLSEMRSETTVYMIKKR